MINAIEATLTAFKNAPNNLEPRIFLTKGLRKATNKNEGKNMPIVEIAPPLNPLTWYSMKVTDEKTGPGVNCRRLWRLSVADGR